MTPVLRAERKYVVDTNLFIDALRSTGHAAELEAFHAAFAPFEYLSAVVAQELLAGARPADAERVERHVISPFERRARIITPSYTAWKAAGSALGALRARHGLEFAGLSRSFVNDVLLATSCREAGMTLVTSNERDFTRIARVVPFAFVTPWPAPSS